jgi:hypothetical protein
MKNKKKICGQIARRYQKDGKKDKGKIMDEYTGILGYNRDYLAHILSNLGKTLYKLADGKPVKIIAAFRAGVRKSACADLRLKRAAACLLVTHVLVREADYDNAAAA